MSNFATLEIRDVILLAAALVGVYLAFLLLRILRMRIKGRGAKTMAHGGGPSPGGGDPVAGVEWSGARDIEEPGYAPSFGPTTASAEAKGNMPPLDFGSELARSALELEVKHLRSEAEQLRADMANLAEEVRHLKAARNVSPLYSEAMILARQGVSPDGIADRCGISIGEAELVAALARNPTGD